MTRPARIEAVTLLLLAVLCAAGVQAQQRGTGTHSPHGPLNIPCQNCHTFSGWRPIRSMPEFDHNQTRYPLRGLHQNVTCTQCHTKMVFSNVGSKCADCHADIHKRQFGANCERCHSVNGWQVSVQQIQEHQNRFPLMGAHAVLACDSCHKSAAVGQFQGLSTACYSCHAKDFMATSGPSHASAGFSVTCEQCHNFDNWFGVRFDHLKYTGFALTGMHATLSCTACHINNQFKGAPATCVGCHLPDYQKTTNPNHITANFPQTCQLCHTTAAWQPAYFDHNSVGFSLTNGHANLQCTQCHVNNNYNLTSGACSNCHMPDYNGTTNPNHVQAKFPTDCSVCHNTVSWLNATFNHNLTGFPLTGAHINTACALCHVNGNYNLSSTACSSCHMPDYNSTNNPSHSQAGFPNTCDVCHNTTAWIPASFNHNNTAFPLTGFHTTVLCAQCHVNNNYTTLPITCYGCHQKDYQGTTNPNHAAAGFPTTCQTCHNTSSWLGAVFNHTWFPTNHGGANGVCSTCHTNPSNYLVFTCTNCHTKTQTDQNHQGISGYVYNSTNCYQCHQNGGGG
ncbi:MAG TPA: hypothetical protein VF133_02590 [Terriglobales bacterium]